jgi:hypothetical protein
MSAQTLQLVGNRFPLTAAVAGREGVSKPIATTTARGWLVGRCLDTSTFTDEERERYERFKAEGLHSGNIPTIRGVVGTRADAVRACVGDALDYIFQIPLGGVYGGDVDKLESYCRPFDPEYAERNAKDAARFAKLETETGLAELIAVLRQTLDLRK